MAFESGYYPPGAEYDKNAPWNQPDGNKPKKVDVLVSMTLSKGTTIETVDYTAEQWQDTETEDGEVYTYGGTEYDYTNCDFNKDYQECEWTIPDLLTLLETYLMEDLKKYEGNKSKVDLINNQLKSLRGWEVDELEVILDE